MKTLSCQLLLAVTAVLSRHVAGQAEGDDVTENIGFGQVADSVLEGETKMARVRLGPEATDVNVFGRIVPLSLSQYMNYNFTTPRTVPPSVEDTITMNTTDPAEYDDSTGGKRDFNNTVINFTIPTGETAFEFSLADIVMMDDVNEASEQFILVLEIESDGVEFDEHEGLLVVTILDNNPIFLFLNQSNHILNFNESAGVVEDIVRIQKENISLETEVDISVQLIIDNITTTGEDISVAYYRKTYTILRDDLNVSLDAINITDDAVPETNETFTLSLMKDESERGDTLNVNPRNTILELTIVDNDEAQVTFTSELYVVTEGEDEYVQVCITLSDGVSLDSSLGSAYFYISTTNTSATAGEDYVPTPDPTELTITRGQEIACSNITIIDDTFVEAEEEFHVIISTSSTTFNAGVNIAHDRSTVQIEDGDRAVVGFDMTDYTGCEGESVSVCVSILSPNMTILSQSSVEGHFIISSSSGADLVFSESLEFTLNFSASEKCFSVSLVTDGLVEDTENITLSLQQIMTNTSFGIRDINPNTTTITVTDEDFAVIGFSESSYTVDEMANGNSNLPVCVQLLNGTIAPGISVNYTLEYDISDSTQGVSLSPLDGAFIAGMDTICHDLTVFHNAIVEPDGKITVQLTDRFPINTVINSSITTVNIVNDDILVVSMDVSGTNIPEGASATITISYVGRLHQSSTVPVNINTESPPGTATAADYELSESRVTLTSSSMIYNITLEAKQDNMLEDKHETLILSIELDSMNVDMSVEVNPEKSERMINIVDDEVALISFQEVSEEVVENKGVKSFYVMIYDFNATDSVSIQLDAMINEEHTNATKGSDYDIVNLRGLSFVHDTPPTGLDIRLNFTDDNLVEGHEVISISLTQPTIIGLDNNDGARLVPSHSSLLVIIRDDDEINIGFNSTSLNGTEGGTVFACIESYGGVLSPGISLDYIISAPRRDPLLPSGSQADTADERNLTVTEGGDYMMISIIDSLTSNRTSACVNIQLLEDEIVEVDEVFLIQVEQARSSDDLLIGLDPEYAEIKIIDNDEIMIGFEMSNYQFSESAGSLPNNVTLVRENLVTVSFDFTIIVILLPGSTATEADFSVSDSFNVTITFSGDDDRQPFPLEILHDVIADGNETIELRITTPEDLERVRPGAINTTTITIIDDDFIPYRYTKSEYSLAENDGTTEICVSAEPGMIDFVNGGYLSLIFFTSPLTATASDDYFSSVNPPTIQLTNASSINCTNVTVQSDMFVEGQETFELYFETDDSLGSYVVNGSNKTTITILDSNVAEVGFQLVLYTVVEGESVNVTFCVAILSGQLTDVVSLDYSISPMPETASENVDYNSTIVPDKGTLSLQNNISCHSMEILDDNGVEPPETILVSITATGPSQEFINLFNITEQTDVQIVDDDSLSIGFVEPSYTVMENDGMVEVCLRFMGPLKNDSSVELAIMLEPDTAGSADFSGIPIPNTLTLNLNMSMSCVSINITDDILVEGTEEFLVHFNETDDNQINIAGTDNVTVSIRDDEVVVLEFVQESYTFSETTPFSDAVISIMITNYDELVIQNDVIVNIIFQNDLDNATESEDFDIVSTEVRINTNNNSTFTQLVITNDPVAEGIEFLTLTLAGGYVEGMITANVASADEHTTVFIEDDDVATIGFLDTSYTTPEGVVMVCVRLMSDPDLLQDNVVIRYSISQTNITASVSDFIALQEEGEITSSASAYCHSLSITEDDLVESPEDLLVNLHPVFNVAQVELAPSNTTVTIRDTDAVKVGFRLSTYSIHEMDEQIAITIERQDNLISDHGFTIRLSLSSASNATNGSDFIIIGGPSQEIVFGPMEMTKELTVGSVDDNIGEGDEMIILDLVTSVESNVINVVSDQNSTTYITIIEDDMIDVSFTEPSYSVTEGESIMEVCASIVSSTILPENGMVDLLISTTPNTATNESDYVLLPELSLGILNVDQSMTCFTITAVEDVKVEGTEDFYVQFKLTNRFGSFVSVDGRDVAVISIIDDDKFEIGFNQSVYVIDENAGVVDAVSIVKLNENELQMHYNLTIHVLYMEPHPAVPGMDFHVDVSSPFTVTFETVHTQINIPITLLDDEIEEGYETFTLQLSYNETDNDGTVQITPEIAVIHIKDDDVVVIGFERDVYIVFEGLTTEVCVSILERELTNDENRHFDIGTTSLDIETAATELEDYTPRMETRFMSRMFNISRHCFEFETIDDDDIEQPEKLEMSGATVSHLIEFNPDSTTIWIIDDESLLLPVPDVKTLQCTPVKVVTTLTVTCTPVADVVIAKFQCWVDGKELPSCTNSRKRAAELNVVTIDLLKYMDGRHMLDILGLTQTNDILRSTLDFYGLAEPFALECTVETTESGLIDVSCETERVLDTLTCTVDDGDPEICALNFVLDPEDYDRGNHTVVVTATNLLGETTEFTFTFDSSEPAAVNIWNDREFVAAIAIAGVALIILLLLLLTICLLIFYHRRVSRQKRYTIDHGSGGGSVLIENQAPLEMNDYGQMRRPQQPSLMQSQTSSSSRAQSPHSQSSFSRPLSQASTMRVSSQEPVTAATAFHVPPPPPPQKYAAATLDDISDTEEPPITEDEKALLEGEVDTHTEEELLLATGGSAASGESRGLKISRRHSIELKKEKQKKVDEEVTRSGTFSGSKVVGVMKSDAHAVAHGKEMQTKEWEAELQREFEDEIARERDRERVRVRERRREMEQRERRREREQKGREYRAQERKERERMREAAKEKRLGQDDEPMKTPQKEASPTVIESPESFL